METIIALVRLGLRRSWRALQEFILRNHLAALPPVRSVVAVLGIGLLVPMALGVNTLPAYLARSLAVQRLRSFAAGPDWAMPETSPDSSIYSTRPVFYWKAHAEAARYRFNLYDGDVLRHHTERVTEASYAFPAPGRLEAGHTYRFTVEALDRDAASLGQVAYASFSVKPPDDELHRIRAEAQARLEPAEAALVLAGLHAARGDLHDLRSALGRYLAQAPADADRALAQSILDRR